MKYRIKGYGTKFHVEVQEECQEIGSSFVKKVWFDCDECGNALPFGGSISFDTEQEAKDQIAIFMKPDKIHEA